MKTTIAISTEVREEMKEFGSKGESYDEIVRKLIKSAKERQLHDLLLDETDTIPVKEALARAREKWQKS